MRERMNSSEQRSFDFSVQVYRRLLRVYPNAFLDQFGDQLVQGFGDLAQRALRVGGLARLMMLWMRILPDLAVSGVREHSSAGRLLSLSSVRLGCVFACMFGLQIGLLVSEQFIRLGMPSSVAHFLWPGITLGFLQSAWALKQPVGEVLRWTAATAVGLLLLALPGVLVPGFQSDPSSYSQFVVVILFLPALAGAVVGLLQSLVLPKGTRRHWLWIAANAIGLPGANMGTMAIMSTLFSFGFDLTPLQV